MKAIAGLDLSALPLGKRFDMLLKHLDEDDSDGSEASETNPSAGLDPETQHLTPPTSQADGISKDLEPFNDFNCLENSLFGNDADADTNNAPNSDHSNNSDNSDNDANANASDNSDHSESEVDGADYDEEQEILAKMYKRAGVKQPKKSKPENPKSSLKQQEEQARNTQKMDRSIKTEVGMHTVKPRSVDSFLRSLGELEESEEEELAHSANIASSPPRVQGLVSFVGSKPAAVEDYSDDEDLEIIPETKTNRMSQAMRDMLQFSGGGGITRSDKQLNSIKEQLQRLSVKQAAARRAELLKEREGEESLMAKEMPNFLHSDINEMDFLENTNISEVEPESGAESEHEDDNDNKDEEDHESELEVQLSQSTEPVDQPTQSIETAGTQVTEPIEPTQNVNGDNGTETDEDTVNETEPTILNSIQPTIANTATGPNQTQYVEPVEDIAALLGIEESDNDNTDDDNNDNDDNNEEEEIVINDKASEEGDKINEINLPSQIPFSQHLSELKRQHLHEQAELLRKGTKPNQFIENEAEESGDDVRSSAGNESGTDTDTDGSVLNELVDDSGNTEVDWTVKQKYMQEEMQSEQKLLQKVSQFQKESSKFLDTDDEPEEQEKLSRNLGLNKAAASVNRFSMQKPVSEQITLKSTAFFASVSESLIMKPESRPVQQNSIEDGLRFLRSIAENDRKGYDADLRSDDLPDLDERHEKYFEPANLPVRSTRTNTLRTNTLRMNTRMNTRINSRTSTLHDSVRNSPSTYASRVCATEGSKQTVEILHSLKRTSTKRATAVEPILQRAKKVSLPAPASRLPNGLLFKRNWSK